MRSPHQDRAGRDRWLMSYADVVTLLFACVTTAYAAQLTTAESPSSAPQTSPMPASATVAPVPSAVSLAPLLAELRGPDVEIVTDHRGVVISLPESATFPTNSAMLTTEARHFLSRLAAILRVTPAELRIEGHTDDIPVSGGRYLSNWELSTARASAVIHYLVRETGIEPQRLSAAGYGEFHPRAPNHDAGSRARNRRVDLVIREVPQR